MIIKLLNYIQLYNRKIGMLFSVISKIKNDLINFAIIFIILFQCFINSM